MATAESPALRSFVDQLLDAQPDARERLLESMQAADPALAAQAERCLAAASEIGGFLDPPNDPAASRFLAVLAMKSHAGERVGPYRLERPLGEGGMGSVYFAVRDDGILSQRVAVKLIMHDLQDSTAVERFTRERTLLARLEHANIARVIDAGVAATGAPYLVMEFVEGEPIDEYCRERNLDVHDRLQLVVRLCDAVQHAHRRLVIHGDIKPQNVLVTVDGEVKLVDFGVSQPLDDARAPDDAISPRYAGPERGPGGELTTGADIYSLGVLLHDVVLHDALAGDRPIATLPRSLRDLGFIITRCTEPDPDNRYASVQQLSEDIRRFLNHEPVHARRQSAPYRMACFVRRNRSLSAVVAFAALGLSAAAVASGISLLEARSAARRADAERTAAELANERSTQVSDFLRDVLASSNPYVSGGGLDVRDMLLRAEDRLADAGLHDPVVEAEIRLALAEAHVSLWQWRVVERLIRPAVSLLDHSSDTVEGLAQRRVEARRLLSRSLTHLGLPEGTTVSERALIESRSIYGPTSPDTAAAIAEVAFSCWNIAATRDAARAEALYLESERMLDDLGARSTSDAGRIAFSFAAFLQFLQRDADAAAQFERALAEFRAMDEPPDRYVVECFHRYSWSLMRLGRIADALQAVDDGLAVAPPDIVDWTTASMHWRRARILVFQGSLDDARAAFTTALAQSLEVTGRERPDDAGLVRELTASLGNPDSATSLDPVMTLRAYTYFRGLYADAETDSNFAILAECLVRSGTADGPDKLLEAIVRSSELHGDDQSLQRAIALLWLADCRRLQGRLDEATSLIGQSGETISALVSPDRLYARLHRAVAERILTGDQTPLRASITLNR